MSDILGEMMEFRVCELFAGVGGFKIGLGKSGWKTIWANQWEPSTKAQYAADCYLKWFPEEAKNPHFNIDISNVTAELEKNKNIIPDHDLLVGGFPCQDYSVATTQAQGMYGKKGVLWWEIEKIARIKRPPYILLENVDRLLVSPSKQRGRDMTILLACLRDLGYSVEWRVINAADYGFPQKRRRVFIFAFQEQTAIFNKLMINEPSNTWLQDSGLFAREFKVKNRDIKCDRVYEFTASVQYVSDMPALKLENSGLMTNNKIFTSKLIPNVEPTCPLESILEDKIPEEYFINPNDIDKPKGWSYVKGSKKEERTARNGHVYHYAEGAIPFPDKLDTPARTILTGEGNMNPNRSTHVILDPKHSRYRTLTPIEVEKLNGFPINHTDTGMSKSKRYFCMGNALVVGVVERIGSRLKSLIVES